MYNIYKEEIKGEAIDQFAGSGIVGEAYLNKNRLCILIEQAAEFIDIVKKRLAMSDPFIYSKPSIQSNKRRLFVMNDTMYSVSKGTGVSITHECYREDEKRVCLDLFMFVPSFCYEFFIPDTSSTNPVDFYENIYEKPENGVHIGDVTGHLILSSMAKKCKEDIYDACDAQSGDLEATCWALGGDKGLAKDVLYISEIRMKEEHDSDEAKIDILNTIAGHAAIHDHFVPDIIAFLLPDEKEKIILEKAGFKKCVDNEQLYVKKVKK